MKNRHVVVLIAALAIPVVSTHAGRVQAQRAESPGDKAEEPGQKASLWMKQKLNSSRDILEGMILADYERIEKNARAMQVAGYLEGWARADVPGTGRSSAPSTEPTARSSGPRSAGTSTV